MFGKRILVTGGGGFLGSHVAEAGLRAGYKTHVFSQKIDESVRMLLSGAQFTESSILDREGIREACEGTDVIFHIAGITSIPKTIDDPLGTHKVNVDGTLEVLEAGRISGVRRFVFISSASVYGNTDISPIREDLPYAPLSPYALHKVIGEQYTRLWHSLFGMEIAVIRPFNIYGPRQRGDLQHSGIITRLFENLSNGKPVEIFGDGDQTRDFIHVRDVAEAILLAGFAPEANGRSINIGSGVGISINEATRTISDLLGVPFAPRYQPARAGEVRESVAGISLARTALGWTPTISFREGTAELVTMYKK